MVWGFTLKGEAIFENALALYVKFAFNYFSQRKTSRKAGRGSGGGIGCLEAAWGAESVGDESHLETVSET